MNDRTGAQQADTSDTIVDLLYQGILRRPADKAGRAAHSAALRSGRSITDLLKLFIDCPEFRAAHLVGGPSVQNASPRFVPPNAPAMHVECHASPFQLSQISERIGKAWSALGAALPFYSVITQEEYRPENLNGASLDQFWATGEAAAPLIQSMLSRYEFGSPASKICVEYGCGVGRVTFPLARMFKKVHAYDISPAHLKLAEERAAQLGLDNIEFHLVSGDISRSKLETCHFFFSCLVFQHNPPPLIYRLIEMALQALLPGGIANFQVPTYGLNYRFSIDEYVGGAQQQGIEMHFIPQPVVFQLIEEARCRLLEVREDGAIGHVGQWISSNFVVKKREDNVKPVPILDVEQENKMPMSFEERPLPKVQQRPRRSLADLKPLITDKGKMDVLAAINFLRLAGTFVEVGTFRGDFANELLRFTQCDKLYCVDPYQSYNEYSDGINNLDLDLVFQTTKARLSIFGDRVSFLRKFSVPAAKDFDDCSVDLVYLDGNHQYQFVMRDLAAWYPKVCSGGLLCGDDAYSLPGREQDVDGNIRIVHESTKDGLPRVWGTYGVLPAISHFAEQNHLEYFVRANQFYVIKN